MNKTKIRATEQPIAVDIEGLSAMLSCGRATARKIGEQAGAKIVIGRSSQFRDSKEKVALRTLNDTLHNIEVITYDEIVARAHRIIKSYDK